MGGAPFAESCQVYAPRYRQAHVLAFLHLIQLPNVFDRKESAVQALRTVLFPL
jgi:hypothetical protein